MTRPKMILFDYGHTLLYEPTVDMVRGYQAIIDAAAENPRAVTAKQMAALRQRHYQEAAGPVHALGLELCGRHFLRYLLDYFQLKFPAELSLLDLERMEWDAAAPSLPVPGVEEMLHTVREMGIRTAVLSNMENAEHTLAARLCEMLPGHPFEFVMVSSEYQYRKPHPAIFHAALRKANLQAAEMWYCGDNVVVDIDGAAAVGIFPVYLRTGLPCGYRDHSKDPAPRHPHLAVDGWAAFCSVLRGM